MKMADINICPECNHAIASHVTTFYDGKMREHWEVCSVCVTNRIGTTMTNLSDYRSTVRRITLTSEPLQVTIQKLTAEIQRLNNNLEGKKVDSK